MAWTIPDPPDNSCFILDKDDQGYPQLSWNLPEGPSRDFGKAYVGFFLALWILVEIIVIACLLVDAVALVGGKGGASRIVFPILWLVGWSAAAYCLARILHKYLIDPDPESLILTDSVLKYDPGFSNYYPVIARRTLFIAKKIEIPRQAIREIYWQGGSTTWHWWKPMRFLYIRHGYDELEVGPSLNNSDSEWLGALLKGWVDQGKLASVGTLSPTNQLQPAGRLTSP